MQTTGTPIASAKDRRKHWLRVCRPLLLWGILVLGLFALHTHERMCERTRLLFFVSCPGQGQSWAAWLGPTSKLDNREIKNGERVPLGWHTFTLEYAKAEPFQTNLFIWYGVHDLGNLSLARAHGVLDLKIEPKARLLTVRGPEFNQSFTNCAGFTLSLPTDNYSIETKYAHWEQNDQVGILSNQTNLWRIAPRLGALALTCNREEASFELIGADNRLIESGIFPASIGELPEGKYRVVTRHHKYEWQNEAYGRAGTTNQIPVELAYGKVVLETEPSGASVTTPDGRGWGYTPLTIEELSVGSWKFTLNSYEYEIATVALDVTANQTVHLHTNLVSRNYTAEMESARQYLANADYDRAAQVAGNALLAKRNDPAALKLQREAGGFASLSRAKGFGKQGDYISGIKELEKVTNALPENGESLQLLADFKTREPEQREKLRLARLNRGEVVFKNALARQSADDLFESHELKTNKPVAEVQAAILKAFGNDFRIKQHDSVLPQTFDIEAMQEFKTALGGNAGRRIAVIVGAQTTDEETQVLFKVLEYKTEAVNKLSIGNLLGVPEEVKYIPMHPARVGPLSEKLQTHLAEGVSNVTARIQSATAR